MPTAAGGRHAGSSPIWNYVTAAEDRIRAAKATGLTNLPLHGYAHNQIWVAIVALVLDLTAWTQRLALTERTAAP